MVMVMATARDIISSALKKIGVLATGQAVEAEDAADGLSELNRMIDSWSAAGMPIFHVTPETFNLAAGVSSYEIGAGGDFDTSRPIAIVSSFIRDVNGHDYPVMVRPTSEYWPLGEKSTQSRPKYLFYDPVYPRGVIYVYYTPAEAEAIYLLCRKPLVDLATLATAVSFPEGYERAFIYNLAVELAPNYGRKIPQLVAFNAQQSLGVITGRNLALEIAPVRVGVPGVALRPYNVEEG